MKLLTYIACLPGAMLAMASAAQAATAVECLQFTIKPNGDAEFHNMCSDPVNLLYCVEADASLRPCGEPSNLVVTLHYGVTEALPGFVSGGKPLVRSAVCFYPEAPIQWRPESGAYSCKKTCVMC